MDRYVEVTEKIREFTERSVKKTRYEHSVRVAEMCARICRFYSLDAEKGYLAGIGHDMCKDFPIDELLFLAAKDGNDIIDFERNKPSLLHGRAAAVLMNLNFGIRDEDILEAVANHTSGKSGMCDLSKALFIADKIEPGRPQATEKYIEQKFSYSFDGMFYSVLKENYDYLVKKGYMVFPGTEDLLEEYKVEGVE